MKKLSLYAIVLNVMLFFPIFLNAQFIPGNPLFVTVDAKKGAKKIPLSIKVTDPTIKRVSLWDRTKNTPWKEPKNNRVRFIIDIRLEKSGNNWIKKDNEFWIMFIKDSASKPETVVTPIVITGEPLKSSSFEEIERIESNASSVRQNLAKASKIELAQNIVSTTKNYILLIKAKGLPSNVTKYRIVHKRFKKGVLKNTAEPILNVKRTGIAVDPLEYPVVLNEGEDHLVEVYGETDNGKEVTRSRTKIRCLGKCPSEVDLPSANKLWTRAVVGMQFAGASSAESKQAPFLDFFFTAPILKGKRRLVNFPGKKLVNGTWKRESEAQYRTGTRKFPRFSLWGNVRFSSIAEQASTELSLASIPSAFSPLGDTGKLNDVVSSFEVLTGVEVKFFEPHKPTGFFGLRSRTIVSGIGAFGFSNPLSSQQSRVLFKIPKNGDGDGKVKAPFLEQFPDLEDQLNANDNISIVNAERDRFFRQWQTGLRFRTLYYDENDRPRNLSPAIFDVTVGQNEAVTDVLSGMILKFDGFYPFPIAKADYIYLFGTAHLRLQRSVANAGLLPFALDTPGSDTVNSGNTLIVEDNDFNFLRSNRDRYTIGVGIDLIKLYKRLTEKPKKP